MQMMEKIRYTAAKWQALVLLVFGRRQAAMLVFDRMISEFPSQEYAYASKAHILATMGQKTQAIEWLQKLTLLHSSNGHHWFNLGFLQEENADYDGALHSLTQATVHAPELDRAWYGLGLVLIRHHRYDEAITALKRNTQLQPMSPYGWYQLARVHMDRQEPEEARKIIRHLKGFEPKVAAQLERETGIRLSPTS